MDTLHKQVTTAHRRLLVQRFLSLACWSCFATLLLGVFAALANWYWSWGLTPWALLAAGVGAGVIAGGVFAAITRGNHLQAAIEIDKRFGLKERVSSAMALDESAKETQAGRALTDDAVRRVKNLHVAERFGVSLNRWSALPLAPALTILILAFLLPDITSKDAEAETTELTPMERTILQRELRDLDQELKEKIEKAKNNPALKDAADLFEKLEQDRQALAKNETTDKKDALVKLNEMAKGLEDRKQQLEALEKVKQQLSNIEGLNDGPAEELARSLQKGDLNDAMQQLQKLADQIRKSELSKEDADKLQKQLQNMQAKLDDAIKQQQDRAANLQKQIDKARQSGNQKRAQQLQKQLDQMQASQQQQQQMMQQMSQKLGECAQCMSSGNGQKAADALSAMAGELGEMQYDPEELGMLSEMSEQMDQLRNQLSGMGMGQGNRPGGNGLGGGPEGVGDRPEEETNTGFHDSQASVDAQNAQGIVIGEIDGPNRKGMVREAIKNQMNDVASDSSDALTEQKLNRAAREHVREYFERMNQGSKSSSQGDGN